jgi:hypothetical protein
VAVTVAGINATVIGASPVRETLTRALFAEMGMWDTFIATFVGWSETSVTLGMTRSDIIVTIITAPVYIAHAKSVLPFGVFNTCITVSIG